MWLSGGCGGVVINWVLGGVIGWVWRGYLVGVGIGPMELSGGCGYWTHGVIRWVWYLGGVIRLMCTLGGCR